VTLAEGGGEAATGLFDAVAGSPDRDGGGTGCGGDPGAYLLGMFQQRPRLVVELRAGGGERDSRG
jgi:hypothetical protein